MPKFVTGTDEWWPVFDVYEPEEGEGHSVELTDAEFAEYKTVRKAFQDWQIRLGNEDALWMQQDDD